MRRLQSEGTCAASIVAASGAIALLIVACSSLDTSSPVERTLTPETAGVTPAPEPANPPGKVFVTESAPRSPDEERASFTVPPGFEVQLVASEPQIQKPMQLAFDERGRLLVSTSTNYPLGPGPEDPPSDRVMLIEIDGETGAAVKVSTFADGFNICTGIEAMPDGRVLLGHAPDILLLTDNDGDGVADAREVLYTGFARTDTHELPNSFTWGVDGWLYGLQGHVNESDVRSKTGELTKIHHGNVYRLLPDGSKIEVWARGMSNPWGLTFDTYQNLFAADCESRPLWQIVEGFAYQGFLQSREPLGFAPYITEDAHGASGFAGLACYTAEAYPPEYRDCLYLGNPISGRVHRDRPKGNGSTLYALRRPDFVVSSDPWFRPVDVELGPDGALYVADWYNRIIAHVEVPLEHPGRDKSRGRIWRIVYRGQESSAPDARHADAIGRQFDGPMGIDWSKADRRRLVQALAESNAWIRRSAAAQLAYRFKNDMERPLRRVLARASFPPIQRTEALWLLHRSDALKFKRMAALTEDAQPSLRAQATRIVSEAGNYGEDGQTQRKALLLRRLSDPSPFVVREAALGLRRVPNEESLRLLLSGLTDVAKEDSLLEYAMRLSIREHLSQDKIILALGDAPLDAKWEERVVDLLAATPTETAVKMLWGQLQQGKVADTFLPRVLENLLVNGDKDVIQAAFIGNDNPTVLQGSNLRLYAAILLEHAAKTQKRGLDPTPVLESWALHLAESKDSQDLSLALEIGARRSFASMKPAATRAVTDGGLPAPARRAAAVLSLNLDYTAAAPPLLSIVNDPGESASVRSAIAQELGSRVTDPARFELLLKALHKTPSEVYLGAIEGLVVQQPGVQFVLDAVEAGVLSPSYINTILTRLRIAAAHHSPELDARYARLTKNVYSLEGESLALIDQYRARFAARAGSDSRNGQILFEQNCMVCHRIGGVGGMRGPNLDGVGQRGIDRILQDIIMPSHDIDPAFRTTIFTMKNGVIEEGLIVEEDEKDFRLLDSEGEERPLAKDDIENARAVWVSPMPSGFGKQLPEKDFLDLVGFLLNPPQKIERIVYVSK